VLREDFEKSKKFFERAIQLDSGYAEAYAGLADLYDALGSTYSNIDEVPKDLLELKEKLARKAVQLNPNSAFANYALGIALVNRPSSNPDSGYFYNKKAFNLEPSNSFYISMLSYFLSDYFGLHSPTIPLTLKAINADPLDPSFYAFLGSEYAFLGKYSEAKKTFQTCMELTNDPFYRDDNLLGWLVYFGDFDEVEKRLSPKGEDYSGIQSFLYATKGELDKIRPEHRNDIMILLAANRKKVLKDVIKRIEEEIEKGNKIELYNYDFLTNSYYFDAYRKDPDFKRVLAKAKKNHDEYLSKYGKIKIPE